MAVYGVTRVSTLDQVEGSSLKAQERKIGAVAEVADLKVDRIFSDPGVSGSVPLSERPQGGEMVRLLQPEDTVIVMKIDRIFRSAADALNTIEEWRKRDISLIIADFGTTPVTENGVSKLMFGILSMVAEFERETIRERTAMGRTEKKAKGGHIGGSAPFGYRKVGTGKGAMLEPVGTEQNAIDRMVELQEDGMSLRAISEAIAKDMGFKVSHVAVRNALARRQELGPEQ